MKRALIHLKNSAIYGNIIINSTHWVTVNDFSNMMDYDNISNALNRLIAKNIKSNLAIQNEYWKKNNLYWCYENRKNEPANLDLPPKLPLLRSKSNHDSLKK